MKNPVIIFSLSFTFAISISRAQSLNFKTYNVSDGLVANTIKRIFQDSKGFMWIATVEGLSKYDGHKFTNFTTANGLSHSFSNDFFEADGKLYVAQNNGCIDAIKSDRVENFFSVNDPGAGFGFFLHLKNGKVLISTDGNEIYEYRNANFYKPAQKIHGVLGARLVQVNDSLILGMREDGLNIVTSDYRIAKRYHTSEVILSIYKDSKNRIWVCTYNGLKLLDPFGKDSIPHFLPLPYPFNIPLLTDTWTSEIMEDKNGDFWIGTARGLVRLATSGGYSVYSEKDGLPSSAIQPHSIYQDRENNIWAGTNKGLVKIVLQNNIHNFKLPDVPKLNYVTSIAAWAKNNLVLATNYGFFQLGNATNNFTQLSKTLPGHSSFSSGSLIIAGSTPLLVYVDNILSRLDSITNRFIPIGNYHLRIADNATCTDASGISFIGLNDGIAVIKGKKLWIEKIINARIPALTIDRYGYLWTGTWDSGLYRIQYSLTTDSVVFNIRDFSQLIGDKSVRSLFCDSKGNIWVGTRYKGAFCLSPKNQNDYAVTSFNQSNGLTSDIIRSFAETSSGDIWIGSHSGLDKLVKEKIGFRVFNFSRISNCLGSFTSILPAGNNAWYCVLNGELMKFTDQFLEHSPPLQVAILTALLGDAENKRQIPTDSVISLKYFQNQAQFSFSAPGFINEKQIHYSYRLLGSNDTNWSKPQSIHEVSYASLNDGNYIFQVRTMGWNGQPGAIAGFHFIIKPPFWKTAWFLVLCFAVIGFLFYGLYKYRISQLVKWQKARDRIATDLHDDIGSALTNISILAELSGRKDHQAPFLENLPSRISEESILAQQALDDIIWSVNSNNDNLDQTLARMRRYAAEVFDPLNINCKIDFANSFSDFKLNMEQRRDIYLVYKECLNNIIKHAAAKNVFITIDLEKPLFNLKIEDDGKGFDPLRLTDRNGLKNMRSRVKRWKGRFDINSAAGKGTIIKCHFPLASPK